MNFNCRDAARQKSTSPISENGPYNADSYLTPTSPGAVATSTPNDKNLHVRPLMKDQYLTPLSESPNNGHGSESMTNVGGMPNKVKKELKLTSNNVDRNEHDSKTSPSKVRSRRLRSASCEDLSDYLRSVVYDPISKSMNDLDDSNKDDEDDYLGPEPFPRLQSFSGIIECEHNTENYYNIEGLKGKIYDGPSLPFAELRKKFSKKSLSRIRRSVSNPNFIGSLSLEKLNLARVSIGITTSSPNESRSSSLANLIPEALKKHLSSKESSHKGSHSALSSGAASKNSSLTSSRTSSAHASPYNSLSRKHKHTPREEIVGSTSVKGINLTRRSRSFRRQKEDQSRHGGRAGNQSEVKGDVSNVEADASRGEAEISNEELQATSSESVSKRNPSELNSNYKQEGVDTEGSGQINMSDLAAENKDARSVKIMPKPSPKPKPKPVANGNSKDKELSATSAL